MTTICITFTAPTLKDITRGISSDWSPTIHAAARRLGAVVGLVWALCSLASDRWQQLVAWAQEHQLHGLARMGLPGGNLKARHVRPGSSSSSTRQWLLQAVPAQVQQASPFRCRWMAFAYSAARPGATKMVTHRQAAAATPANVAQPSIRHLAAQGFSQREISSRLGVSRHKVRKALSLA